MGIFITISVLACVMYFIQKGIDVSAKPSDPLVETVYLTFREIIEVKNALRIKMHPILFGDTE